MQLAIKVSWAQVPSACLPTAEELTVEPDLGVITLPQTNVSSVIDRACLTASQRGLCEYILVGVS